MPSKGYHPAHMLASEADEIKIPSSKTNRDKDILLSISDSIARVRKREDLLHLVNEKLKTLLPFEYGEIQIIDKYAGAYKPANVDLSSGSIATEFHTYLNVGCPSNNSIVEATRTSAGPLVFDLEKLANEDKWPLSSSTNYKAGLRELVMLPLRNEKEFIGCLAMFSKYGSFQQSHLRILQAISSLITIAVENIQTNEEVLERENEKSMLLALSNDITSCRTYQDIQNLVSNNLPKYFQFNEILICLNSPDNLTHKIYSADLTRDTMNHPQFEKIATMNYFINDGVVNVIQNSLEPVIFDMNELISRQNRPFYIDFCYDLKVKELIGFPMRVNNECIGGAILFVKEKNTFSKGALQLAQAVCSYLGIALNNIRTLEQIENQLEEINRYKSELERENNYLQEQIKTSYNIDEIIGIRNGMAKVFKLVSNVAPSDTTVLLQGETGTGKELIAAAIHNFSSRRNKLMVKLNCAALPSHLVESELFGHEKGSFTGATERRIGKFELANHGTLFLDEVGELPLDLQSKLLRALQEKEIERIGGNAVIKTDVRVIAASNRDLKKEVETGKFRSDLFYRLNVFPILLPSLRERKEDIPLLVAYFVEKYSKKLGKQIKNISPKTVEEMTRYNWPGNVRELEHVIERAVVMTTGNTLNEISLSFETDHDLNKSQECLSLEANERAYILSILKKTSGKICGDNGAAKLLDIPPTTLHSKMKKLGIKKTGEIS
jgi:transcriptional regulator with GAF, ATPase, and Fis domain